MIYMIYIHISSNVNSNIKDGKDKKWQLQLMGHKLSVILNKATIIWNLMKTLI